MMKWKRIAAGMLAAALIINDVPLYANAQENINVTSEETGQESDFDAGNTDIEQPPAETEEGTETPAEDTTETEPATEPTEEPTVTEEPAVEEPAPTEETQEAEATPETEAAPMAEGEYEYTLGEINPEWPVKGINIYSAEEMCKLSHVDPTTYQKALIKISMGGEIDLTGTGITYDGLGTKEVPFQGTFQPGSNIKIILDRALFQGLSNQATQNNQTTYNISLTWRGSTSAVWAENYVVDGERAEGDSSWTFQIANNNANSSNLDPDYKSFAGLIGTMSVSDGGLVGNGLKLNTDLTAIANNFKVDKVSGDSDVSMGVFCRDMQAGAVLDISGSTLPTGYSVTASGTGSAGGLVGTMGAGAKLICKPEQSETVSLTNTDKTITAGVGGNAGALVGTATDAIFDFGSNTVSVDGGTISGGSNVGGLIGSYTYTGTVSDSTNEIGSNYQIQNVTLSPADGGNAGGVFGSLTVGTTGTPVTFSLGNESRSLEVGSTLGKTAANYGGLVGVYSAGQLADTLNLNGNTELSTSEVAAATITSNASGQTITGSYGGAIASVVSNSYVLIRNMAERTGKADSVPNFGGLLGNVGDGCTIQTNGVSVKGNYSAGVTTGGGLIGSIGQGSSFRLDGVTRLEEGTIGVGTVQYGQLVGTQNNSLIYAKPGWAVQYVRNNEQIVDDIGSYGQVVRLNATTLTEEALLSVGPTTHAVQLNQDATYSGTEITLSSAVDFAKLSLMIQSRGYFSGDGNINSGNYSSAQMMTKNISMTADIDMSSTGIQGLTRDSNAADDKYQATFAGGGYTLKLTIGEIYGGLRTGGSNGKQGAMVAHDKLGLFAGLQNATVKNLKLSGSMNICNLTGGLNAGGIAGLGESGNITIENVETDFSITNLDGGTAAEKVAAKVGGLLGRVNASGSISITKCNTKVTIANSGATDFSCANMIGYLQANGATTVTMTKNTISGSITDKKASKNPWAGGVIGYLEGNNNATVNIRSLTVGNDETTNANNAAFSMDVTKGGLLGYCWDLADVMLQEVKVNHAALTTSGNFGGLLYEASGRITISKDATSPTSASGVAITNSTFTGNSTAAGTTDALLVCMGKALYLNVDQDAYSIGDSNDGTGVTITKQNHYFDELVGQSINTENDTSNGIVSYNLTGTTNGKIDQSVCDTYHNKTKNGASDWVSGEATARTRYYYNLPTILSEQNISDGDVNTANELMLWSILHYAAPEIQKHFGVAAEAYMISGEIDLTGYSYYPVTVSGSDTSIQNATITFDHKAVEDVETDNLLPSAAEKQHYMMHGGLIRNLNGTLHVGGLTLQGNVGHTGEKGWENGSGALICGKTQGSVSGTTITYAEVLFDSGKPSLLKGICVDTTISEGGYAPLLINKVGDYSHITIAGLRTTEDKDSTYSNLNNAGGYAATSLIGAAGSNNGTNIVLSFSKIWLDARENVGELIGAYGTTRTLFANATFLESFQYAAGTGSSGTYNFTESEDWSSNTPLHQVTYGKEISDSIRNAGNQYNYYNSDIKVHPTTVEGTTTTFQEDYRPYVAKTTVMNSTEYGKDNYQEIDVNLQLLTLDKGCGTYGDPYIIESATQMERLAAFLNSGSVSQSWSVNISNDVSIYHTSEDITAHSLYKRDGTNWQNSDGVAMTDDEVRNYLNDAYYQIVENIELSSNFDGIGVVNEREFRGVIVGKNLAESGPSASYPTITLTAGAPSRVQGLISYSYGSVVKDLNINYAGSFKVNAASNSGMAWGGVFGDVLGGDNIIDNVNVTFDAQAKVIISGTDYSRLAMVGGYVGVIEAGGVVFRNMEGKAKLGNVALEETGKTTTDDTYFYVNPYVGRVLDGYAICEGDATLNNTDKNYKIHTMSGEEATLQVTPVTSEPLKGKIGSRFYGEITVADAEDLFLLSSIVNCGASAFGDFNDVQSGKKTKSTYISYAYRRGKVRTASYDEIGNGLSDSTDFTRAQQDDSYGKTAFSEKYYANQKTPYLIYKYTTSSTASSDDFSKVYANPENPTWYVASCLTGGNTRFDLTLTKGNFNLSNYGNGYRGIGARYTTPSTTMPSKTSGDKVETRADDRSYIFLLNFKGNDNTITLATNVCEYSEEYVASGDQLKNFKAESVGGIFNHFMQDDPIKEPETNKDMTFKTIGNVTITGKVSIQYYDNTSGVQTSDDKADDKVGVGGLIGNFAYAKDTLRSSYNTFENITFSDLTVSGSKAAGGLLGSSNESSVNVPINLENCNIKNLTVSAAYAAGGLIGNLSGGMNYETSIKTGSCVGLKVSNSVNGTLNRYVGIGVGGYIGFTGSTAVIDDITMTKSGSVNNELSSSAMAIRIGGVIGSSNANTTLRKCTVKAVKITGQKVSAGGLLGYMGNANLTVENCTIGGDAIEDVQIQSSPITTIGSDGKEKVDGAGTKAAGVVAEMSNNSPQTIQIENSIIQNARIDAYNSVGGLLADETDSRTLVVKNVTVQNNTIQNASGNGRGGLVGKLNNGKIHGSNVLLYDNRIIRSDAKSDSSNGLIAGNSGTTGTIQLAGISRQVTGTNTLPDKEVGGGSGYTGYIVYADYTGAATTDSAYKTGANAPYVTVNPESPVTVYETADATGTVVTGDASAMMTDNSKSVAQKILDDYNASIITRYTGAETFAGLTTTDMLTSYNTVQGTSLKDDFPVLQISTNDRKEATEQIAAYLDMVTNGGYTKARGVNAASSVHASAKATSYQYTDGKFVPQTDSSISVLGDGTSDLSYRINPGKYDNTKNQFTLLDVTFGNDTTGQFVLRVPIIVKQVVTIETSAVTQNDSPFYNMSYEARKTSANHILLGSGQTFTTQLTYTYSNYDWKEAANGGGNLRWNYDKKIDFDNGPLLNGTVLTLVDPNQNGKHYSYTVTDAEINSIKLSDFQSSDGAAFSPITLDQLIGFKAEVDVAGTLVKCDKTEATVAASLNGGIAYFRPKNDKDADTAVLYQVSTTAATFQEQYYLVADTAEGASTVINGMIVLCNMAKDNLSTAGNGLPYDLSQEQNDINRNENVYLINTKFVQTLTSNVSTWQSKEVTKGEEQTLDLTDTIQVSQSLRDFIQSSRDTIFQQFSFEFNDGTTDVAIPNGTEYQVVFTLYDGDKPIETDKIYQVSGTVATPQSTLNVTFPGQLADIINSSLSSSGGVSVLKLKAAVTFTFPTENAMSIFPAYPSETPLTQQAEFTNGHIQINTTSRMSYSENALLSGEKVTLPGNTWYYQTKDAKATLDYNGDELNQLGINIRDLYTADAVSVINTTGVYNLSTLADLDTKLARTQTLECKLTFEQKGSDGNYKEVTNPENYLDGIYAGKGAAATAIERAGSTYTWNLTKSADGFGTYYDSSTKCFTLPFEVRVKNDIETTSGTYANFKITLTVTPKDSNGSEVLNAEQDFIIYTFAKVPTTIVR
ncbi:MAG: hypothetical protein PHW34_03550 [Hespellia sp.]|nr:hypothetical protein [Hespellia sp.]